MTKRKAILCIFSVFLTLFSSFLFGQDFGEFASAIRVNNTWYNFTPVPNNTNSINNDPAFFFDGFYLGSYTENSNSLNLNGGQVKTWKNSNGNVCGAEINYKVYLTSAGPGSTSFTPINIGFGCNCTSSTFSGCGGGPCSSNDQLWTEENANTDLTQLCPGNYTLEVFIRYWGDQNGSSGCSVNKKIDNTGANYKATFDITTSLDATTQDETVCENDPLTIGVSPTGGDGNYTYSWSGPNSFSSTDQNPTINTSTADAGAYNVIVTDGCGSTVTKTVNVTVHPTPQTSNINPL